MYPTRLSRYRTVLSLQKILSVPVLRFHPTSPQQATFLTFFRLVLPLLKLHINRIIQYVLFCVWLLLVNILYVRFIHVLVCISALFFLLLSSILLYTTISLSIILLMDIWIVSCLTPFINTAILKILVQVFCRYIFLFFWDKYLGEK